jgi:hypothetical protein
MMPVTAVDTGSNPAVPVVSAPACMASPTTVPISPMRRNFSSMNQPHSERASIVLTLIASRFHASRPIYSSVPTSLRRRELVHDGCTAVAASSSILGTTSATTRHIARQVAHRAGEIADGL